MLTTVAVAVLFVGAASPARALDAPEGLTVADAEGNPVPDINITNAAPGDSVDRTWFISLADGAPPAEITYLLTNFRNVEVGCNEPESELDETCEEEADGKSENQALSLQAAATGLPGELDENMSMILAAGTVDSDATSCAGDRVTVSDSGAPSSFMDNPQALGDGTLVAGERLCVAVSLSLPFSATNIVQSDQLAFNFLLNTIPAQLPPTEEPPNEPTDPTNTPPDPEEPPARRPEPPIGRSQTPRPPLAATGLGIATLLMTGAALLSTGTLAVKRARRGSKDSSRP